MSPPCESVARVAAGSHAGDEPHLGLTSSQGEVSGKLAAEATRATPRAMWFDEGQNQDAPATGADVNLMKAAAGPGLDDAHAGTLPFEEVDEEADEGAEGEPWMPGAADSVFLDWHDWRDPQEHARRPQQVAQSPSPSTPHPSPACSSSTSPAELRATRLDSADRGSSAETVVVVDLGKVRQHECVCHREM
jgi:hypothetical protein